MSASTRTKASNIIQRSTSSPRQAPVIVQGHLNLETAPKRFLHSPISVRRGADQLIMAGPRRTIDSYFRRMGAASSKMSRPERGQEFDLEQDASRPNYRDLLSQTPTSSSASSSRRKTSTAADTTPNNGARAVHRYNQQQKRTLYNTTRKHLQLPDHSDNTEQESLPGQDEEEGDREDGDPYNLTRFLIAQDQLDPDTASPFLGTYSDALRQLRRGKKTGHWVWYIFPQMPIPRPTAYSSGRLSEMSVYYGIRSLGEATAYLAHEVLGGRLKEITSVVLDSQVKDGTVLMGGEGDLGKLGSCMTLFGRAWEIERKETMDDREGRGDNLFKMVLEKYFDGETDALTEEALDRKERQ